MKIGITGATSGLGNGLAKLLISDNHDIKVLARKSSNTENLKSMKLEIILGDITDYDSLLNFVKDIDICYHLAALVGNSEKSEYYNVNVFGTKNICKAIISLNPSCRLIYCSSIAVFRVKFFNKFIYSHYTISKYLAEKIVNTYSNEKGLITTIIYPGYIYGPDDRNLIPTVVSLLKNGLNYLISGGEKNAPIVYIDDICELFYIAGINKISIGKKYIGLKNHGFGVHDFIRGIADKLNFAFPGKKYPKFPMVVLAVFLEFFYKIFKIKSNPLINLRTVGFLSYNFKLFNDDAYIELGWMPKVSIKEGLDRAVKAIYKI